MVLIAVVALVALMAATALTIDLGYMLVAASHCQNLADALALAGAGGQIIGYEDQVVERLTTTLQANHVEALSASFSQDELLFYAGGSEIPNYGFIGADDEALTVTVRMTRSYLFGRALGLTTKSIVCRATALRMQGGDGNALFFAISPDSGDLGIDLSGSRGHFHGLVHSNTRVDVSGSNHRFYGPLEWRNRLRITGSGTVLDEGDTLSDVQAPPIDFEPSDFEPYDYVINGDYNVPSSGVVPPGCYRVYGDVHVSGSSQQLADVTFVADGEIRFSGSNHFYSPNRHGVFAFSLSTDSNSAINISGSAPNCSGTLYAPNGCASFSGSDHTFTSVVAWTIDVSGSDYHAHPSRVLGEGQTQIKLIH